MSWASRRRTAYASVVIGFFALVIGTPLLYWFFTIPATCTDGKLNQGETAIDRGGPCPLLDERMLSPSATLWSRSFRVRDGSYNAVAYIQNSNEQAGVRAAPYIFRLYDAENVLIAEREGLTYIMPGSITPVFEGGIPTGNRIATRTYFEFTQPLTWEKMEHTGRAVEINDKELTNPFVEPRVTATARNTSVRDIANLTFIVAVFDAAGNAFAASRTAIPVLRADERREIVFTWPDPFNISVGRIDIIPLTLPKTAQ